MRRAIACVSIIMVLATVGLLTAACQRYGPNDPARLRDNPELQGLRDSRRNGLPYRCVSCHQTPSTTAGATGAVASD